MVLTHSNNKFRFTVQLTIELSEGYPMGKWVYVSDNGPNDGCGCLMLIVIAFLLIRGCL